MLIPWCPKIIARVEKVKIVIWNKLLVGAVADFNEGYLVEQGGYVYFYR